MMTLKQIRDGYRFDQVWIHDDRSVRRLKIKAVRNCYPHGTHTALVHISDSKLMSTPNKDDAIHDACGAMNENMHRECDAMTRAAQQTIEQGNHD